MTARALAVVALRVWGAMLLGWALATVPITVFVATLAARGAVLDDRERLAGVVAHLLLALALILFAEPIARRAIPEDSPREASLDAAQIFIVALTLVGVFLLANGVQHIAAAGYLLVTRPRGPLRLGAFPVAGQLWERQREQIARSMAAMSVGVVILCRDRLARVLAAARWPPVGE